MKWVLVQEMIPACIHKALKCVAPHKRGRTDAQETVPILLVDEKIFKQDR